MIWIRCSHREKEKERKREKKRERERMRENSSNHTTERGTQESFVFLHSVEFPLKINTTTFFFPLRKSRL